MRSLLLIALLIGAGCVVHVAPALQPASPTECRTSPEVTGVWTSSGLSQLGPARTKYTFGCDCVVETKSALLWTRLVGAFRYSVTGSTIILEQKQPREVHFTRDGDTLLLVWPGGDRESLTLDQPADCAKMSK